MNALIEIGYRDNAVPRASELHEVTECSFTGTVEEMWEVVNNAPFPKIINKRGYKQLIRYLIVGGKYL